MKNYYRVILGKRGKYAEQCYTGNFIGLYSKLDRDLNLAPKAELGDFRHKYIPIMLEKNQKRTKISASIGCGYLYTIAKRMNMGDIVISPDGKGSYLVGEISGGYSYHAKDKINHRRIIKWYEKRLDRLLMSEQLQRLTGIPHTVINITKCDVEIDKLLSGQTDCSPTTHDESVENPQIFALEKHLEDFLVKNWTQTELGERYDIYEEDGEKVGQQYQSDTGPIDILAVSKDKKELLVVELKKGRASDSVVGQIQRYMGFVKDELAEENQTVKGVIIALEDDLRLQRSLEVAQNIDFYRYEISFSLIKKNNH